MWPFNDYLTPKGSEQIKAELERTMIDNSTFRMTLLAALIAVGGTAAMAKSHGGGAAFERLDADGDGAVTMEEMKAHAEARFDEADGDNDGFVSPQEMTAARTGKRAERMLERFDTDGNGQLSAAELEAAADARSERRVERMLKRLDADGDGKLSKAEMLEGRDPARMFERLDKDNSGSLSKEEFAEARKGHKPRHGH